jgi:hypothetical protein
MSKNFFDLPLATRQALLDATHNNRIDLDGNTVPDGVRMVSCLYTGKLLFKKLLKKPVFVYHPKTLAPWAPAGSLKPTKHRLSSGSWLPLFTCPVGRWGAAAVVFDERDPWSEQVGRFDNPPDLIVTLEFEITGDRVDGVDTFSLRPVGAYDHRI